MRGRAANLRLYFSTARLVYFKIITKCPSEEEGVVVVVEDSAVAEDEEVVDFEVEAAGEAETLGNKMLDHPSPSYL